MSQTGYLGVVQYADRVGSRDRRREWPFRTDLALLALIAVQPLEQAVPPAISLTKVAGAICLVALILDLVAAGRALRFDAAGAILLVLLAIGCVSLLVAESPSDGVATTIRYAGFVLLFVITTQFVDDPRLIPRLLWVLSLSASVAAVLAVSNTLGGRSLFARPTYGDANDLAYILATTLPLTAWLIYASPRRFKPLAVACVLTMATGLICTLSRGALVGLVVAVAFLAWTEPRTRKAVALSIIVVAAIAASYAAVNRAAWLTAVNAKERVAAGNVEMRVELWRAAVIMTAEHPLLGVGPGNFSSEVASVTGQPLGEATFVAHDAYLEVGAEFGIAGLVAFLAFLGMQWSRLGRAVSRPATHPLAVAVRTSFVVALVGALTLSEQFFAPIWIAASLATVLDLAEWRGTGIRT